MFFFLFLFVVLPKCQYNAHFYSPDVSVNRSVIVEWSPPDGEFDTVTVNCPFSSITFEKDQLMPTMYVRCSVNSGEQYSVIFLTTKSGYETAVFEFISIAPSKNDTDTRREFIDSFSVDPDTTTTSTSTLGTETTTTATLGPAETTTTTVTAVPGLSTTTTTTTPRPSGITTTVTVPGLGTTTTTATPRPGGTTITTTMSGSGATSSTPARTTATVTSRAPGVTTTTAQTGPTIDSCSSCCVDKDNQISRWKIVAIIGLILAGFFLLVAICLLILSISLRTRRWRFFRWIMLLREGCIQPPINSTINIMFVIR